MSQDSKQLITIDSNLPAEVAKKMLAEAEVSLHEMVAGIDVRPPQIKIMLGGVKLWELGDEKGVKPFLGVILANSKANAYWHQEKQSKNPITLDLDKGHNYDLPLCSSTDGVTGSRIIEDAESDGHAVKCFGQCSTCFLNKFETARAEDGTMGKGKACKNGRRLVVFKEGYEIPFLLTLPPTSIKAFDTYVTNLRNKSTALWSVYTKFDLEAQKRGGQEWSVFCPGEPVPVDPVFLQTIYEFRMAYKKIVTTEITDADFEVVEEETDADLPI